MATLEEIYAAKPESAGLASVTVEVFVDAETLKKAEEIVQGILDDGGVADFRVEWDATAWTDSVAAMRER